MQIEGMSLEIALEHAKQGKPWFIYMVCVNEKSDKFWATWGLGSTFRTYTRYGSRGNVGKTVLETFDGSFRIAHKKIHRLGMDRYQISNERVLSFDPDFMASAILVPHPVEMSPWPSDLAEASLLQENVGEREHKRKPSPLSSYKYQSDFGGESPEERMKRLMKRRIEASVW